MPLRKFKTMVGLLALALALAGCTPSPETVGDLAKTSIQEVLRVDPRFKGAGVEIVGVHLVAAGERRYKGSASIEHNGVVHEVPINVLLDGLTIKWETAPDAFSFVPQDKPPR